MKLIQRLSRAACVLAVCGMLVPAGAHAAPAAKPAPVKDVALATNGDLTGALLTPAGQPLDGAVVSVRQGGKQVAEAVTTSEGTFRVAGLKNGTYEVAVGQQGANIRVWPANIAPPSANSQAVLVIGQASRGQYGTALSGIDFISLTTLGASITAAVLAGVTLGKVNDLEKEVNASP